MATDTLQPVIAEDSMLAELPEDDDAEVAEDASGSSPSTEAEPPEAEAEPEPIDDAPDPNGPDTEGEQADPESGEEQAEREAASALAGAAPAEPGEEADPAAPEWALEAVPVGGEELEAEKAEEEGFDLMRWFKKNWMWAVPTAIVIYLVLIGLDTDEERRAFPGNFAPFQ